MAESITKTAKRGDGARPLAVEGLFQSLGQGLAETYLSAYALWLGAGSLVLGLVANLPTASTALAQSIAMRARVGRRGARSFIAWTWSAQAVCYAALGLCAFLPGAWRIGGLVLAVLAGWGFAGMSVPAWTALVSSVVDRSRYGWFFALRGAVQQVGVVVAILGGGLLLGTMRLAGAERSGFLLLFLLAGLSRILGNGFLAGVSEVSVATAPGAETEAFRWRTSSRKFRRLAHYLWAVHLGTQTATPFFVPYMLAELRFSYTRIACLLAVPAIVKITTLRLWGRVADRVRPGPLLRAAGWFVAPVPFLWLVSASVWWIVLIQVCSGLVWGAFEVAQASALLQTTGGKKQAVAFFNLVDGAAILGGSLVGGTVVWAFQSAGRSGYLAAMATSGILRFLPAAILLWRVRGIGTPPWSHQRIPLRLWAIRPSRGMSFRPWAELPPLVDPEQDERSDKGPDS